MFGIAEINSRLRPHQPEPVRQILGILERHQTACDFSDCGVGKTYVSAAVAACLQVPTLVVCPKIVQSAWHRAAAHFGDTLSVINYEKLRTGKTPFGKWVGRVTKQRIEKCESCQCIVKENSAPCFAHPIGIHCLVPSKTKGRKGRFEFAPEIKLIIGDEAHRFSGLDSENAEMLIAAKRQGIKILLLTATPATSPLGLRAIGYAMDLHGDKHDVMGGIMPNPMPPMRFLRPNFYRWVARYGCRRDSVFHGWRWPVSVDRQIEIMKDIRDKIIPARGVRVTTESILDFPERQIDFEEYDVNKPEKIDALYHSLAEPLAELQTKRESDAEHPLTKILRARQEIELLKTEIFSELAADFVEKGFSVALFLNFRASIQQLEKELSCSDVIDGENTANERQDVIDRFQDDRSRIILVQTAAGSEGLSLHDMRGEFPRVGLISPSFSARELIQAAGRLHRSGGRSKCLYRVIFAARTIESQIARALQQKGSNLSALTDGDLMFPVISEKTK